MNKNLTPNAPLILSQTSCGFYIITSKFPFSHSVLILLDELSAIPIKSEIVVWKLFQFGRVYNLSFGKGLTTIVTDIFMAYVDQNQIKKN